MLHSRQAPEVASVAMFTASYAYRRRLPHYQNAERTYLITFNTMHRWTLPPIARDIVLRHIQFDHLRRIWLSIAIVMPDHVHMIGSPFGLLANVLKGIKGASAKSVNKALGRTGAVWQDESFDHELPHEESVVQKGEYIAMNPVWTGLGERPEDHRWVRTP